MQKYPTCILCGIRGHIQRDCPGRPCTSCGLPSHDLEPCEKPPVWKQHCQRCGMTGHLSDVSLCVSLQVSPLRGAALKEFVRFVLTDSASGAQTPFVVSLF